MSKKFLTDTADDGMDLFALPEALQKQFGLGVWQWDIHSDQIFLSQQLAEDLDFKTQENMNLKQFLQVFDESDQEAFAQELHALAADSDSKQARDTILSHSRKLELLNQEKDNMLNIAAHDLKNPLGSILLMAEMTQIKQGRLSPEKILDYANAIYQDADRMLLIITNLLDVNKIESGVIQTQWQEWLLQEILNRLQREYTYKAEEKSIQLEFEMPELELKQQIDPLLLFQALDNLLSNALKFSEPGQKVWVRLKTSPEETYFEIEDQGPGFSDKDLEKMYQKFSRLSAQPTAGENSTGLGLAIVKRLCEMLQIDLQCKTKLRHGTCFKLVLNPIVKPEFTSAD